MPFFLTTLSIQCLNEATLVQHWDFQDLIGRLRCEGAADASYSKSEDRRADAERPKPDSDRTDQRTARIRLQCVFSRGKGECAERWCCGTAGTNAGRRCTPGNSTHDHRAGRPPETRNTGKQHSGHHETNSVKTSIFFIYLCVRLSAIHSVSHSASQLLNQSLTHTVTHTVSHSLTQSTVVQSLPIHR